MHINEGKSKFTVEVSAFKTAAKQLSIIGRYNAKKFRSISYLRKTGEFGTFNCDRSRPDTGCHIIGSGDYSLRLDFCLI